MSKERRTKENSSVPRSSPSSPVLEGMEFEARRAQRLRTAETLRHQRTPLQVIEVAEQADRFIQTAVSQLPPAPPLACREGCAWCCHKLVGTTAPEVFRIADYIQESLPPEGLEIVR